jgi:hypothetical protein
LCPCEVAVAGGAADVAGACGAVVGVLWALAFDCGGADCRLGPSGCVLEVVVADGVELATWGRGNGDWACGGASWGPAFERAVSVARVSPWEGVGVGERVPGWSTRGRGALCPCEVAVAGGAADVAGAPGVVFWGLMAVCLPKTARWIRWAHSRGVSSRVARRWARCRAAWASSKAAMQAMKVAAEVGST